MKENNTQRTKTICSLIPHQESKFQITPKNNGSGSTGLSLHSKAVSKRCFASASFSSWLACTLNSLTLILEAMCISVRTTYALIIIFEEYKLETIASCQWRKSELPVSRGDLTSDDVIHVEPGQFPTPFKDVALLIPLYTDMEQFGAILFGRPINGIRYSQADVDMLLYPSDQVADAMNDAKREQVYLSCKGPNFSTI